MPRRSAHSYAVRLRLTALLVVVAGIAVRLLPRVWTPFPYNPDGFRFARQAEQAVASGQLPLDSIGSHGYGFPTLLSHIQLVTGVQSLTLTQPTIAVIGTVPALVAFILSYTVARDCRWPQHRALFVAFAAGFILTFEGLFLRRTVRVHYEVLGIVLFVSLAIGFHWYLQSGQRRWLLFLAPLLAVLPITHHLSSVMAGMAVIALTLLSGRALVARGHVFRLLAVPTLFWAYIAAYYISTRPPYFDDLAAKPGLFGAWLVVLGGLVAFTRGASATKLRAMFAAPLVVAFGLTAINALTDVFPGTATTHPRLVVYVGPLVLLAVFVIWGVPIARVNHGRGPIVFALILGPVAFIGFSLSAGLSPEYSQFAHRSQTFAHISVAVIGALAVGALVFHENRHLAFRLGVPLLLLVAVLVSAPLAFTAPPVLPYESTTTDAEFATVTFAERHLDGEWTSDDHLSRVGTEYYRSSVAVQPTVSWLQGGTVPACPTVVRESWTTVGAQAYPADPVPADSTALQSVIDTNPVVYDGGPDSNRNRLVVPTQLNSCSATTSRP